MSGTAPAWVCRTRLLATPGPTADTPTKGLEAQKLMSSGSLVPDAMILELIVAELTTYGWLKKRPQTADSSHKQAALRTSIHKAQDEPQPKALDYVTNEDPAASFILDGFPRTAAQADQLDTLIPMNLVVHIDTPSSIILDRITNRWIHERSGRVYNTTFNPPKHEGKDDITGETLTRREDDSPETWKTRLRKFEDTSMPLLEHYDKLGVLWRVKGNSSDEISPKLFEEFGKRFGATT